MSKPSCYGCFPHQVPPMMEDCYRNCKGSIILCKQATHEKEDANLPLWCVGCRMLEECKDHGFLKYGSYCKEINPNWKSQSDCENLSQPRKEP